MTEKKLKPHKNAGYLITDYYQRRYFSGIDVSEGFLFVSTKKVYFTDSRYTEEVDNLLRGKEIESINYSSLSDICDFIKGLGVKTLFIDYSKTNVNLYKDLKKQGFILRDSSNLINQSISIKSQKELTLIKKACEITEKAYYYATSQIREGITELEVKEIIENKFIELGADGVAFETIVAFGEGSSVPHHVTGDKKLEIGNVILIDMGAKYKGYSADLTRTAVFRTAYKEFIDDYNLVLTAQTNALNNIKSGMRLREADGLSRRVFESENKSAYFLHSLGHGLGLEVHEYPTLSPKREGILKNGMVFTIEPGIYFKGKYGIRIEDTVVLDNGKVQRLFTDSKELLII